MKRFALVGMLFLAAGCAHQSTGGVPVKVVVTASPDAAVTFNVDTFRRMLQQRLGGMSTPQSLALAVNIDSTDRIVDGPKASLASGRHIYWKTLFTFSSNDAIRGGADQSSGPTRAAHAYASPDYYTAFGGQYQKAHEERAPRQQQTSDGTRSSRVVSAGASQPVVVGTYTITDTSSRILEHQPIVLLASDSEPGSPRAQLESMQSATRYLSDAVVAVDGIFSRRSGDMSSSRTH